MSTVAVAQPKGKQQQHPSATTEPVADFGLSREHLHGGSTSSIATSKQPYLPKGGILPQELRRILVEVSTEGSYNKLPWMEVEYAVPRQIPRKRPASSMAAPPPPRNAKWSRPSRRHQHLHHHRAGFAAAGTTTTTTTTTQVAKPLDSSTTLRIHTGRRLPDSTSWKRPTFTMALAVAASGSEQEDTLSQCDENSESTSVTSVSELSYDVGRGAAKMERSGSAMKLGGDCPLEQDWQHWAATRSMSPLQYKSLSEAFREGVGYVLEHYYKNRGGYKLSATEMRQIRVSETKRAMGDNGSEKQSYRDALLMGSKTTQASGESNEMSSSALHPQIPESSIPARSIVATFDVLHSAEERKHYEFESFQRRKERIVALVGGFPHGDATNGTYGRRHDDGPPFTLQRIAEVLIDPERYYSQTHKVCNALEKLLLVSTTVGDFGGSFGGDAESVRSYLEDIESSKERRRLSHRRLLRKGSSGTPTALSTKLACSPSNESQPGRGEQKDNAVGTTQDDEDMLDAEEHAEILDPAARASLRAKFEHIGVDRFAMAAAEKAPTSPEAEEKRKLTGSPPLPNLLAAVAMPLHGGVPLMRPQGSPSSPTAQQELSDTLSRLPAPKLSYNGILNHQAQLQINHAAAINGVSPFHLLSATARGARDTSRIASTKDMLSSPVSSKDPPLPDRKDVPDPGLDAESSRGGARSAEESKEVVEGKPAAKAAIPKDSAQVSNEAAASQAPQQIETSEHASDAATDQ